MRKKEHLSIFYEFSSLSELSYSDRELIEKAEATASNAYAPYSGFKVGSAVLMENGQYFEGNNQENFSFPAGMCAERVALFYAKSQFPDAAIQKIAITAVKEGSLVEDPPVPCGECLQAMLENERRDENQIKILLYGSKKIMMSKGVRQFLPMRFEGEAP